MIKNKIIFVLLLSVALSGCSKTYMAEREFYKAAQVLREVDASSEPDALEPAIAAFQQVVNKYPGTPKALESLQIISNIRLKQKKFPEARAAMVTVVENFSGNRDKAADARYRIGQIFELEGKWSEAENVFWELAEYNPLHVKGLYAPVRVLLHYKGTGDEKGLERSYVRALDHYTGLIKQVGPIDPAAGVKNYLAMTYVVKGETAKAIAEWKSIQEQFPKNPYAPMALLAAGEIALKSGAEDEAEALYASYYEKYPQHPLAGKTAMMAGMQYQGLKKYEQARRWYQVALDKYFTEKSPEQAEIKLLLAKTYQDEVLWDEANAIYEEIEAEYENTSAALQVPLLRASYFGSIGEEAKSKEILDEAIGEYQNLEVEADDERVAKFARRFRSAALAQKGSWDQLVADVDKYYEQETTPEKKGRWLFLKGLLTQNRLKDAKKAVEIYQRFLSEYPDHALAPRAKTQLEALAAA